MKISKLRIFFVVVIILYVYGIVCMAKEIDKINKNIDQMLIELSEYNK